MISAPNDRCAGRGLARSGSRPGVRWVARTSLAAMAFAFALAACHRSPRSPEEEIRELLAQLVDAAESGQLDPIAEAIAPNYTDEHEYTRPELLQFLRMQVLANQRRYIHERVSEVVVTEEGRARAELFAVIASSPLGEAGIDGEVYRVRLRLTDADGEGQWQIIFADWDPATTRDLMGR